MKNPTNQRNVLYGKAHIQYELVYSKRKTLAIHVYADGKVFVRAPSGSPLDKIEAFILTKAKWILRHQMRFQEYVEQRSTHARYTTGEKYLFLGQTYPLSIITGSIERVEIGADSLTVHVNNVEDRPKIARLLDKWYRTQATKILSERLAACFPRVQAWGVKYPPLTIRTMKSRWGSCRSTGKITLNLRLMQVDVDLIDYIILHELCHLREMNHSRAFYALMDSVLPDWKAKRERLKRIALPLLPGN